jgi:hypothetical protein
MEIKLGFDSYTNRARLAPALLVVLPLGLAFATFSPTMVFESAIGGLVITLAVGMLLTNLSRDSGRKAEKRLLRIWKGFPTVGRLRHRNSGANAITRERYHSKLRALLPGTAIPTAATELLNPDAADAVYESCVMALREKTRDSKRFPLVFEENVTYGFRRNLWAMKPAGIAVCLIALAFCGYRIFANTPTPSDVSGLSLAAIVVIAFLLAGWLVRINPSWVRDAAEAYADRLLATCDEL